MKGFILLETLLALLIIALIAIGSAEVVSTSIGGLRRLTDETHVQTRRTKAYLYALEHLRLGRSLEEVVKQTGRRFEDLRVEAVEGELEVW